MIAEPASCVLHGCVSPSALRAVEKQPLLSLREGAPHFLKERDLVSGRALGI